MTAAPLRPDSTHPRRRRKSYTFFWCSLGIYTEALLFLLSSLSDACEPPPTFEAMELKGTPKPYYAAGETIEYKCKKGYLYLYPYLMISTCEPNHKWVPISDDGCIKVQCTMLQDPSFGKVHYIDGRFSWGARAKFICMEGYYLVGISVLHCVLKGDDAYWNGHPPSCEKVYCLPPPKIKNGRHTFTDVNVFKYHEAVIYSCDTNPGPDKFSLVGTSMLFCAGHNTWSNNPPECKVVKCPFPVLKNGRQIPRTGEKFSYQATVMFECVEGFYMEGSSMVVCSANNSWEPSLPKCLKGPKPTHLIKPSVYNYPEYPSPREGIFGQELDAWVIALIGITSIVGVFVICLIILRYFEHRKKGRNHQQPPKSTPPTSGLSNLYPQESSQNSKYPTLEETISSWQKHPLLVLGANHNHLL